MSSAKEIQDALKELSPQEFAAFREWFVRFDATLWDRQFEQDVAAGRLDQLGEEAINDVLEGRSTDL
jgi:hypothetical protein